MRVLIMAYWLTAVKFLAKWTTTVTFTIVVVVVVVVVIMIIILLYFLHSAYPL